MSRPPLDRAILAHRRARHELDTDIIDTPSAADHGGAHNTLEV